MKLSSTFVTMVLLVLIVTACSTASPASNSIPVPTGPARPQPTAPSTAATPTSDRVLFENIPRQTYTDPAAQFSIEFPANWQPVPQPTGGVVFIDPTHRAAFGVQFTPTDRQLPPEALEDVAVQYARRNFGDDPSFAIMSRTAGVVQFASTDPNLGHAIFEVTATQHGQMVYLTQITVVDALWNTTASALRNLTVSLQVLKTTPVSPVPTATLPPSWLLYTNPAYHVAFLYPSNWELSETENTVQVVWTAQKFTFAVKFLLAPGGMTLAKVEASVQDRLDSLADAHADFAASPITEYQVADATGYTADYRYTDADGVPLVGSVIAVEKDGTLYHVSLIAPQLTAQVSLDWFNPMLESFKIVK